MIYFDNAATTPVCAEAIAAAASVMREGWGNPSSGYDFGKAAARHCEADRAVIAGALGCQPSELFFTSCGTEADNWAIRSAVELGQKRGKHIVTTAIEHAAVRECVKRLERAGYEVTWLRPDAAGHIAIQDVRNALRNDTIFVSMMLVNNEIGSLLPIRSVHEAISDAGVPALLHVDAVQGFLKIPFTPQALGADFVAVSGHKVGAPKGIGALYIRGGLVKQLEPFLLGGGQERGLRSGTEATHQIAAFAAAVAAWKPGTAEAIRAVRDYAADTLGALNGVQILSPGDAPHILAVSLPDFSGQSVVEALGSQGICISSGSACHRGRPSHVFAALPLPKKVQYGAVRISFGPSSTVQEVDELARLLRHICQKKSLLF